MRRKLSALIALTLLGSGAAGAADPPAPRELAGTYVTPDGEWDRVEATFTANGSDSWEVEFRFDFQGRSETWIGSAFGSLDSGAIEGRVEVEEMDRSFVFRGDVTDGVLEAEHAELEFGGETPTGTMTLRPVDGDEDREQESSGSS